MEAVEKRSRMQAPRPKDVGPTNNNGVQLGGAISVSEARVSAGKPAEASFTGARGAFHGVGRIAGLEDAQEGLDCSDHRRTRQLEKRREECTMVYSGVSE